jgi:hypothetical protein
MTRRAHQAGVRGTETGEPLDLQREADAERPWTVKTREDSERLRGFKQGEVDRRGAKVDGRTNMADFYVERR